jgi:hypothetical protein
MPPRKLGPAPGKAAGSATDPRLKIGRPGDAAAKDEPQIDYGPLIAELLNECQERISEAMQQRQDNLLALISQCETSVVNSGRRPARK